MQSGGATRTGLGAHLSGTGAAWTPPSVPRLHGRHAALSRHGRDWESDTGRGTRTEWTESGSDFTWTRMMAVRRWISGRTRQWLNDSDWTDVDTGQ